MLITPRGASGLIAGQRRPSDRNSGNRTAAVFLVPRPDRLDSTDGSDENALMSTVGNAEAGNPRQTWAAAAGVPNSMIAFFQLFPVTETPILKIISRSLTPPLSLLDQLERNVPALLW